MDIESDNAASGTGPSVPSPSRAQAQVTTTTTDTAGSEHFQNAMVISFEDQNHNVGEHLPPSVVRARREAVMSKHTVSSDFETSFVYLPENSIEAKKISNNYKFGMKIWKSHVTSRPLDTRSEIVQDLYSDISKLKEVKVSTMRPFNILYMLLFGWWLALIYLLVSLLMFVTIIGQPYAKFCWRMARYFLWPFGKFVHQVHIDVKCNAMHKAMNGSVPHSGSGSIEAGEKEALMGSNKPSQLYSFSSKTESDMRSNCSSFWRRGQSYVWLILGLPILLPIHAVIWGICWFFVVSIPTAKLNSKTMTKILYLPPEEILVGDSGRYNFELVGQHSEIIMYTHQSVNIYYYKYTLDGVNVILANLLLFVILSIVLGYAVDDDVIGGVVKCVLGVLAIIPLTYYIGMAITSISAQSSFAVGAILNATFGSMVEVILFVIMLKKGKDTGEMCYQELVKSSLTGAILCSILFIPGMSMVIGGLKFRTQRFNPRSANISASLLFVAILGVFAPSIFANIFGSLKCQGCEKIYKEFALNSSMASAVNDSKGFLCQQCEHSLSGLHGDNSLYKSHIEPLVYAICIILPMAYIIGLMFTMKTHTSHVFGEFEKELKEENSKNGSYHGIAHWSRVKSTVILLLCAVAIALCADLISENIQPLLEETQISEYFIGVTMLSLVSELPELVNGVQFALQNNVNLGIEIGCSTAIQVCLCQIPLLVLINLIYPMGFYVIFNDIHLWAVVFSVIIINYIFQDGKSDYFQGSIVVFIYILLMCMYFFMLTPENALCSTNQAGPQTVTVTTTESTTTVS